MGRGMRRVRRRRRRVRRRRILLVGGLVAFGAHKMSQRDAQRIEEHTGVPPEELEDEDLEKAMNDLGIEDQEVTEADREQGASGAAPAAPAAGGGGGDIAELEQLADLHAKGILTDEEFAAKKAQVLGL